MWQLRNDQRPGHPRVRKADRGAAPARPDEIPARAAPPAAHPMPGSPPSSRRLAGPDAARTRSSTYSSPSVGDIGSRTALWGARQPAATGAAGRTLTVDVCSMSRLQHLHHAVPQHVVHRRIERVGGAAPSRRKSWRHVQRGRAPARCRRKRARPPTAAACLPTARADRPSVGSQSSSVTAQLSPRFLAGASPRKTRRRTLRFLPGSTRPAAAMRAAAARARRSGSDGSVSARHCDGRRERMRVAHAAGVPRTVQAPSEAPCTEDMDPDGSIARPCRRHTIGRGGRRSTLCTLPPIEWRASSSTTSRSASSSQARAAPAIPPPMMPTRRRVAAAAFNAGRPVAAAKLRRSSRRLRESRGAS